MFFLALSHQFLLPVSVLGSLDGAQTRQQATATVPKSAGSRAARRCGEADSWPQSCRNDEHPAGRLKKVQSKGIWWLKTRFKIFTCGETWEAWCSELCFQ